MSIENASEQKVWKFSYKSWNKLEGIFAASQDEIDWLIGLTIDFGREQNTVVLIEEDFFTMVSDDPEFTRNFVENIGSNGNSPFNNLNAEQLEEFEARFGGSYVNGQLVQITEPTLLPAFLDEGSRVVTFDIEEDLTCSIVEGDFGRNSNKLQQQFLTEFEIVPPLRDSIHLSQPVERYGNGETHCMSVIKRKKDGQLFGYPFSISNGDDTWVQSNGEKHGFERANCAYVWLPVTPFTITGYAFAIGEDED